MSGLGHFCPGASACPDCDPEGYMRQSDGELPPGVAARIADEILASPTSGHDEQPRFYRSDAELHKRQAKRRNPHLDGYGDPRRA